MTIDERVQHYAYSYSGILPKEVIENSKEWWRKELEEVADQAREEAIATYQRDHEQQHIASAVEVARREERAKVVERLESRKIDVEAYRQDLIRYNRCNKKNRRGNVRQKREFNEFIDDLIAHLSDK